MNSNNLELTLIDQLTLLALDDEKGTFVAESNAYSYALAGALIMELALQGRIDLSAKKVLIKDRNKTNDKVIDRYFDLILESAKERTLKSWIRSIGEKASKIKLDTVDKLIDNRILSKREDKILWVFTYNKYPMENPRPENKLRKRLYDVVVNGHRPELKDIMILNLIQSCGLGKEVFGKEQVKTFKKKIETINQYDQMSGAISKTVKEINDEIAAVLVIIIASTVVTTS